MNVHEQFTVNDTEQLVNVHKQPTVNTIEQSKLSSRERQEQAELVKALREQIEDLKADKQFYQSQIVSLTNRLEAPVKASPINPFFRWWRSLGFRPLIVVSSIIILTNYSGNRNAICLRSTSCKEY